MTGLFPGGRSQGRGTDSWRVGGISNMFDKSKKSNMFDILLIHCDRRGKEPILTDSVNIAPDPRKYLVTNKSAPVEYSHLWEKA